MKKKINPKILNTFTLERENAFVSLQSKYIFDDIMDLSGDWIPLNRDHFFHKKAADSFSVQRINYFSDLYRYFLIKEIETDIDWFVRIIK